MKKRVLSLFVVVLMMISMISAFPFSTYAAPPSITFKIQPTVYIGGGGYYNIVWKNDIKSIGYVTYSVNGKQYTVYDTEDGVVRSDDNMHSLRVPMEHLDNAGSYTVTAVGVEARNGYNITLGNKTSKTNSFTGAANKNALKLGFFSDLHMYSWDNARNQQISSKKAIDQYMGGVDLVVVNGDVTNYTHSEADFDVILELNQHLTLGSIPVLYARGNHECWGEWAQYYGKYLGFETDELYGCFDFGPLSAVVIDCAEDKDDDDVAYADTRDTAHYIDEQFLWLRESAKLNDNATYRLGIGHAPDGSAHYSRDEYVTEIEKLGIDMYVCGHSHWSKWVVNPQAYDYPVLHDGGHDNNTTMRTTLVTLANGNYNIKAFNDDGSIIFEENHRAGQGKGSAAPTEEVGKVEEPKEDILGGGEIIETAPAKEIPTRAGLVTSELKGATGNAAFVTKPVIFDGGAYYNVIWQTTAGERDAGYVELNMGTTVIRYKDSVGCTIRASEAVDTHSVRIPKDMFVDCDSYEAKIRTIAHWAYNSSPNSVEKNPTRYNPYVSAGKVEFKADFGKDKQQILVVSNSKSIAEVNTVKKAFGGTPDMVVTLGNMVNALNKQADFGNYLKYVYQLTNGQVPVVFVRGEGETTGGFAAELNDFIRPVTDEGVFGKFYFNSMNGDISLVALDTGAEKADNDASYNGYAAFDSIRREQQDWLSNKIYPSFKNTYNIVFAHADNITNVNGVNMTKGFSKIGANLVVTGQSGKTDYKDGGTSYSIANCGSISVDGSAGLVITCENDIITVESIGERRIKLGEINTAESGATEEDEPTEDPVPAPDNTPTNPDNKPTDKPSTDKPSGGSSGGGTSSTGKTETEIVEGDKEGVDGNIYVRTVKEGWYKDYYDDGITELANVTLVANTKVSEGEFVTVVAKVKAINLTLYTGKDDAEKAMSWADEYAIYGGDLSVKTPLSDAVVNGIVNNLFKA